MANHELAKLRFQQGDEAVFVMCLSDVVRPRVGDLVTVLHVGPWKVGDRPPIIIRLPHPVIAGAFIDSECILLEPEDYLIAFEDSFLLGCRDFQLAREGDEPDSLKLPVDNFEKESS